MRGGSTDPLLAGATSRGTRPFQIVMGYRANGTAVGFITPPGGGALQTIALGGGLDLRMCAQATAQGAIAIGSSGARTIDGAKAYGVGAIAIGSGTDTFRGPAAYGVRSIALGSRAAAYGDGSVAIGELAEADNPGGFAFGYRAYVGADEGFALGSNAACYGLQGVALGYGAEADYDSSVALGDGSLTTKGDQVNTGIKQVVSGCPTTASTAGELIESQMSVHVNEALNLLTFTVKYSSGTVKTATAPLA